MRDILMRQQDAIRVKVQQAWQMAEMFLKNKDAHGIQDAGVEIQALERSYKELEEIIIILPTLLDGQYVCNAMEGCGFRTYSHLVLQEHVMVMHGGIKK